MKHNLNSSFPEIIKLIQTKKASYHILEFLKGIHFLINPNYKLKYQANSIIDIKKGRIFVKGYCI